MDFYQKGFIHDFYLLVKIYQKGTYLHLLDG